MESIKQIKLGIGFLVAVGAPSYLVYDFHKISKGDAHFFNLLVFGLLLSLVAMSLFRVFRLRGESYVRWKLLWEKPIAAALLVASAPALIVSALLIKVESPGRAIYPQARVGRNRRRTDRRSAGGASLVSCEHRKADRRKQDLGGKPFIIYKLRSMIPNAEEMGAAWSSGDSDPRVTRVGYYLRKTHVDELPQLINVLLGHMSIVGPRPERPAFIAKLSETIDGYRERLLVPPGITGLAQVRQKSDESLEDVKSKLEHDKEYIENICLSQDIKIVLLTFVHLSNLFWQAFKNRTIQKTTAPKTISAVFDENPEESRS